MIDKVTSKRLNSLKSQIADFALKIVILADKVVFKIQVLIQQVATVTVAL